MNATELLNSFTEKESDYRPDFKKPFPFNYAGIDYNCATEAHEFIMMPLHYFDEIIEPTSLTKASKRAVTDDYKKENPIIITLNQINSALDLCPKIDEYEPDIKCLECDGTGVVECYACGHEHDCDNCNGTGLLRKGNTTGNKIIDRNERFSIGGTCFLACRLTSLKNICDFTGVPEIQLTHGNYSNGNLFNIGDIKLLIMPVIDDGSLKPFYDFKA